MNSPEQDHIFQIKSFCLTCRVKHSRRAIQVSICEPSVTHSRVLAESKTSRTRKRKVLCLTLEVIRKTMDCTPLAAGICFHYHRSSVSVTADKTQHITLTQSVRSPNVTVLSVHTISTHVEETNWKTTYFTRLLGKLDSESEGSY